MLRQRLMGNNQHHLSTLRRGSSKHGKAFLADRASNWVDTIDLEVPSRSDCERGLIQTGTMIKDLFLAQARFFLNHVMDFHTHVLIILTHVMFFLTCISALVEPIKTLQ